MFFLQVYSCRCFPPPQTSSLLRSSCLRYFTFCLLSGASFVFQSGIHPFQPSFYNECLSIPLPSYLSMGMQGYHFPDGILLY